jgi:hypothetical protein
MYTNQADRRSELHSNKHSSNCIEFEFNPVKSFLRLIGCFGGGGMPDYSIFSHPLYLRFVLALSSHLCKSLPGGHSPSALPNQDFE